MSGSLLFGVRMLQLFLQPYRPFQYFPSDLTLHVAANCIYSFLQPYRPFQYFPSDLILHVAAHCVYSFFTALSAIPIFPVQSDPGKSARGALEKPAIYDEQTTQFWKRLAASKFFIFLKIPLTQEIVLVYSSVVELKGLTKIT